MFKNHVRCVVDEIITLEEARTRGLLFNDQFPQNSDPGEAYWDLRYEALDSRQADGGKVDVRSGCRLFEKKQDGTYKQADKYRRPKQISTAFAGLGINAFPGDPEGKFDSWCQSRGLDTIGANPVFDATKIVGNCFVVEKPPRNRENDRDPVNFAAPLPTAVLGPNYTYTGDVRLIQARQDQANEAGQQAPSPANFKDILTDDEAKASVLAAIAGKPTGALDEALMTAGISHNFQVNGESVMAAAVSGTLAATLEKAGLISVNGSGTVSLNQNEGS